MRKIDTLIHARWVAPADGGPRLLESAIRFPCNVRTERTTGALVI